MRSQENSIRFGEMNKLLFEKIEMLMPYAIDQDRIYKNLKRLIDQLQEELNNLKEIINEKL